MLARVLLVACLSLAGLTTSAAAQKPELASILKSAGDYLTQYAEQLGAVAADEEYTQRAPVLNQTRRLGADVVFVGFDAGVVAAFRDVHTLDTHLLRPRDDRMLTLLAKGASAQDEARALEQDGLRHYLSPNLRVLDHPTLALEFFTAENQKHSEFELDGVKTQDGVQVATVRFRTKDATPMLPVGGTTLTANGRVMVEIGTGAIRQTELAVSNKNLMAKLTAKYARDSGLGLWLPVELIQLFDITSDQAGLSNMGTGGLLGSRLSLEGRSRYSKFRRAGR